MIFVTVGTQLGFDRLIKIVDRIAGDASSQFFAQIGKGDYVPKHMEWSRDLSRTEFQRQMAKSHLIISHAGIGTIISSRTSAIPLILFPRRPNLAEHRNGHQLATCLAFDGKPGIRVAYDEAQLVDLVAAPLAPLRNSASKGTSTDQALQTFLERSIRELTLP